MSFTSDMNLVDMFLSQDDPFLNSEDVFKTKAEQKDEIDWLSDEFLESILKTNTSPFKLSDSDNVLSDKLPHENGLTENYIMENSSDSGASSNDQLLSPIFIEINGDSPISSNDSNVDNGVLHEETIIDSVFDVGAMRNTGNKRKKTNNRFSNDSVHAGEEVVECEEISLLNDENMVVTTNVLMNSDDYNVDNGSNVNEILISDFNSEDEYVEITRSPRNRNVSLKNSNRYKTIKFVGSRRPRNVFRSRRTYGKRDTLSTDDGASDDSDAVYPRLTLTAEEKRLMIKEGIALPSHYPLTKSEEKDLKRIRRKIRNKISAQDSRRRKKEYVDGLEERVKKCSEENARLLTCIKRLETQNVALVSQVRKLQANLGKNMVQPTQPTTCLFVLFLSLALVLAPVLRNNPPIKNNVTDDEGISLSDGENSVASGRSRNLLYAEAGIDEDVCSVIDEPKVIEDVVSKQFDLAKLDDMILPSSPAVAVAANPIVNSLPYTLLEQANIVHTDHDYVLSKKRPASSIGSDSDDMWPTPPVSPIVHQPTKLRKTTGGDAYDHKKLMLRTIADSAAAALNDRSSNRTNRHFDNYPIVIDLVD